MQVGGFNQEKALLGAFSVLTNPSCGPSFEALVPHLGREIAAHDAGGQASHQVEGGDPGGLLEADPEPGVGLGLQLGDEGGGQPHQAARVECYQGGRQRARNLKQTLLHICTQIALPIANIISTFDF